MQIPILSQYLLTFHQHINDLSQQIPLERTLSTAEGMFHQLACSQDKLPPHVCAILGFAPPEPLTTFPVSSSQNLASQRY